MYKSPSFSVRSIGFQGHDQGRDQGRVHMRCREECEGATSKGVFCNNKLLLCSSIPSSFPPHNTMSYRKLFEIFRKFQRIMASNQTVNKKDSNIRDDFCTRWQKIVELIQSLYLLLIRACAVNAKSVLYQKYKRAGKVRPRAMRQQHNVVNQL